MTYPGGLYENPQRGYLWGTPLEGSIVFGPYTFAQLGVASTQTANTFVANQSINYALAGTVRFTIRNTNSGATSAASLTLGNDTSATAGFLFQGSSTFATYGGASSLNLVNGQNAPLALGANNTVWVTIGGSGLSTFGGGIAVDDITDSTSPTTGSIQTDGGLGVAKNLIAAKGIGQGVTSTATAAGTTTLTSTSTTIQVFTGTTTQTVQYPAANLFGAGIAVIFTVVNQSTGTVTPTRAGSDTFYHGGTTDAVLPGASVTHVSDGVSVWLKV